MVHGCSQIARRKITVTNFPTEVVKKEAVGMAQKQPTELSYITDHYFTLYKEVVKTVLFYNDHK